MSLVTLKSDYNKATTFVRPLLGYPNHMYTNNYKNCYIELEPEMKIHLVFANIPTESLLPEQRESFVALDCHPSLLKKEEYSNSLIYTFSVDEDVAYDISQFIKGSYSKMSEGGKQLILFSQYNSKNLPVLSNILWPNEEARQKLSEAIGEQVEANAEVYSSPNLKEELFDKNLIE